MTLETTLRVGKTTHDVVSKSAHTFWTYKKTNRYILAFCNHFNFLVVVQLVKFYSLDKLMIIWEPNKVHKCFHYVFLMDVSSVYFWSNIELNQLYFHRKWLCLFCVWLDMFRWTNLNWSNRKNQIKKNIIC